MICLKSPSNILWRPKKINKKLNNPNDLSGNYNNLAQNYIALKKFPEALTYLNLALKSAGKNIHLKYLMKMRSYGRSIWPQWEIIRRHIINGLK